MPSTLLSRFPLARCTDLDEFLPLVHQAFGVPHSHPVGPLPRKKPYELRGITDPQFTLGLLRNAIGVRIDGRHPDGSYFVNVGVPGTVLSERGMRYESVKRATLPFAARRLRDGDNCSLPSLRPAALSRFSSHYPYSAPT
jgi:hypothetical protein